MASFCVLAGTAQARAQVVIPDEVTCSNCSIELGAALSIGTADGPGYLPYLPAAVALDGRGRIWMTFGQGPPQVYDNNGGFLAAVGTEGDGPEEFREPTGLFLVNGDSMVVLDLATMRASVVGPELKVRRTVQLPGQAMWGFAYAWPDTVLLAANLGDERMLHVVGMGGPQVERHTALGPPGQRSDGGLPFHLVRASPARTGLAWSTDGIRYNVDLWSSDHRKLASLERRPDWFQRDSRWSMLSPNAPPDPYVDFIREDSQGRIWTFIRVPGPSWREAWPQLAPGTREVSGRSIRFEKLYRTMIEVIDPRSRRTIARRQLDDLVVDVLADFRVAIYKVTEHGVPRIELTPIQLVRREVGR